MLPGDLGQQLVGKPSCDAQFVEWLVKHQKAAGVFATVSELVDELSDNLAARFTAQEIAQRVQRAEEQSRGVEQSALVTS